MGKNRINKGTIYWLSNVGPITFEPKMGARPPSLRLGHSETKEKLRKSPFFADCDAAFLTRQPITGQVPFPYQGGPEISRTAGCWHPGMEQELRLCKENIGWWWFSMGLQWGLVMNHRSRTGMQFYCGNIVLKYVEIRWVRHGARLLCRASKIFVWLLCKQCVNMK